MDWKNLFLSFDGRINRAKFWAGIGVLFVIAIIFAVLDYMIGGGIIYLLFSIASLYFSFALYAKRWHDRGKSGWWSLIVFVPIIGAIWILVECGCP